MAKLTSAQNTYLKVLAKDSSQGRIVTLKEAPTVKVLEKLGLVTLKSILSSWNPHEESSLTNAGWACVTTLANESPNK